MFPKISWFKKFLQEVEWDDHQEDEDSASAFISKAFIQLIYSVMSSQHTTLRACVCVFLTHLQQVNWWDFTSSPCSPAPALWLAELCLDWHVSRVTDWWDGCLHTHTHSHTRSHTSYLHVQVWIQGQTGVSGNKDSELVRYQLQTFSFLRLR